MHWNELQLEAIPIYFLGALKIHISCWKRMKKEKGETGMWKGGKLNGNTWKVLVKGLQEKEAESLWERTEQEQSLERSGVAGS